METHDTAPPSFCNVQAVGVAADERNFQSCSYTSLLATMHTKARVTCGTAHFRAL